MGLCLCEPPGLVSHMGGLGSTGCKCTPLITMRHHSEALKNIFNAGLNLFGINRGLLLFHSLGPSGSEVLAGL